MIAKPFRKSFRPMVEMSTPSMTIDPDVSSTSRYSVVMILLFPAPVLTRGSVTTGTLITLLQSAHLPTIPTFSPGLTDSDKPFKTGGSSGLYFSTTSLSSICPSAGHDAGGFLSGT